MARITAITAYLVNLSDGTGEKLLSLAEVNTVIDNLLGEVLDSFSFQLHPKTKLELHAELKKALPGLVRVHDLMELLEDAKHDAF